MSYRRLEALLHDEFWAAEDGPDELPLLAAFLDCHPGRALEVGGGSGRLLLPLLAGGWQVEGLDRSAAMLEVCRARAAARGLAPVLHQGGFERFTPPGRFDALVVPAFTFQFARDPGAALGRFAAWLAPGGALYLSTFVPQAELRGALPEDQWFLDHDTTLTDGARATIHTRHQLDRRRRRLTRCHRLTLRRPGATPLREQSTHHLRWFARGELDRLLAAAGFSVTARIAGFHPQSRPATHPQVLTLYATSMPH